MTEIKFTSRADLVFERLESDILTGVYKRGELLTESELSKSLNVSRTPIREAIRRLEQEHLIKETSKGSVVVGVSEQDILDIYDIRIKIEGVATKLCAENATSEVIKEMGDVIDLQEFYSKKGEAEKVKSADSRFHELIYKNSGSEIYEYILLSLHSKVQLTRKNSMQESERSLEALKEHKEIYLAIKERNGDLAEKLMVKHVTNAKSNITRLK
ncbi:MAG: GntR family transcriptional regulator [Clostridia bacterium]|nr:GntR family transcriptional regulator [Clostridia bacterium]